MEPQVQTSKKSAFDLLMKNVNKLKINKSSITPSSSNNSLSDIVIIEEIKPQKIQQDEAVLSVPVTEKETTKNHYVETIPTVHVKQYDKDNETFLVNNCELKTNLKLKSQNQDTHAFIENLLKQTDSNKYNSLKIELNENPFHLDEAPFNFTKVKNVSAEFLNQIFNNDPYWINLYNKISKKNELNNSKIENGGQNDTINDKNDDLAKNARRSKRRKTGNASVDDLLEQIENETKINTTFEQSEAQINDILWTDKYQFTDEIDIVTNKCQVERLKQWLEQWQKKHDSKPKRINNNANEDDDCDDEDYDNNQSDSDYSNDSECSNASSTNPKYKSYANGILLNGPVGCGKTSSVYCIAKNLNFKVFEVNTSNIRCKSQILQDLVGVLSSHHVTSKKKQIDPNAPAIEPIPKKIKTTKKQTTNKLMPLTNRIEGFFTKKQQNSNEVDSKNKTSRKRRQDVCTPQTPIDQEPSQLTPNFSKVDLNLTKNSLILFDDIDIVLKDDKDFWSVINFFIKKSKKPIILTCNDEFIINKINLNIEEIKFDRPDYKYSLNYLKTICLCEGFYVNEYYLETLIKKTNLDLRKAILQLQISAISLRNQKHEQFQSPEKRSEFSISSFNDYEQFLNVYIFTECVVNKFFLINKTNKFKLNSKKLFRYDYFRHKEGINDELSHLTDYYQHHHCNSNSLMFDIDLYLKEYLNKRFNFNNFLFNYDYNYLKIPNSNYVLNKYANKSFKFTSNSVLYLEYAPYLRAICKIEQLKQDSNIRRRFLHYLNTTNIGLTKDDYTILAREITFETIQPYINQFNNEITAINNFVNKTVLLQSKINSNYDLYSS